MNPLTGMTFSKIPIEALKTHLKESSQSALEIPEWSKKIILGPLVLALEFPIRKDECMPCLSKALQDSADLIQSYSYKHIALFAEG